MFWLTEIRALVIIYVFSKWFCQPCVSDAQNPLLVLNTVTISTAGRRRPSTGARWHTQDTEETALRPDLLMPRPGLAPPHGLIPPNNQQANQWRWNWVDRLRITWGSPREFDHNVRNTIVTISKELQAVVHLFSFSLVPPGPLQPYVRQR